MSHAMQPITSDGPVNGFVMTPRLEHAPFASETLVDSTGVAALSHDVRNILSAFSLYCDLLAEPEVLAPQYQHYAQELRLVANAGGSLLDRLTSLGSGGRSLSSSLLTRRSLQRLPEGRLNSEERILNAAAELDRCRTMLAAIAGPSVHVQVISQTYAGPLPITREDLTRILLNLVRNASEAMPGGGNVRITLASAAGSVSHVTLIVEDDGPGISETEIERVFESGFTTKRAVAGKASWLAPETHGLGLAIVRSLVEAAGGSIAASSPKGQGARFEIVLPKAFDCAATTKDVVAMEHCAAEGTRVQC
jgi:signal transduction histidine kinase